MAILPKGRRRAVTCSGSSLAWMAFPTYSGR